MAVQPLRVFSIFHDVVRRAEAVAARIVPFSVAARLDSSQGRPSDQSVLVEACSSYCSAHQTSSTPHTTTAGAGQASGRRTTRSHYFSAAGCGAAHRSTLLICVFALLIGTFRSGTPQRPHRRAHRWNRPTAQRWRFGDATSSSDSFFKTALARRVRRSDRRFARRAGHLRRVDRQRMSAGHRYPVPPSSPVRSARSPACWPVSFPQPERPASFPSRHCQRLTSRVDPPS